MKKEKNMLQDKFSAGEYLAPRVKVTRLRSRVMCASGQLMGSEDDNASYEDE